MIIGILSANNQRYHPNRRLKEAATKFGHRIRILHPESCVSQAFQNAPAMDMPGKEQIPDLLMPRVGATAKDYTLALIRHFELMGIPVVNGFQSIILARNKFLSLQALLRRNIPVPDSGLVSNLRDLEKIVSRLGGYPVVLKRVSSRQGKGVMLIDSATTAKFVLDNLSRTGQGLLVQRYYPPEERRDLRILVLGKTAVAAMELRPKAGDFRANVHLQGHGRSIKIKKDLGRLAVRASRALGLEISGIDVILDRNDSPKVIDINYSPGFRGLEASTGIDIASDIIQYVTQTYGSSPWK